MFKVSDIPLEQWVKVKVEVGVKNEEENKMGEVKIKKYFYRCSGYLNCCLSDTCPHSIPHYFGDDCNKKCQDNDGNKCGCEKTGEYEEVILTHPEFKVVKNKEENKMIVQYIKDKKGKLGCLVGLSFAPGEYSIGWSKFNRSEEIGKFDKEKAKNIAIGRAVNNTDMFEYSAFSGAALANFPASFANDISDFMERCHRYYHTDKGPTNFNWEK